MLYTDGLSEAENAQGESFGDRRLAGVLRAHRDLSASQLSADLFDALGEWRLRSAAQQDDITWIVVDVL